MARFARWGSFLVLAASLSAAGCQTPSHTEQPPVVVTADQAEAQNRARIEAQVGRALGPGPVTVWDVIDMTRAHVDDLLIINHIRFHGTATLLTTADLNVMGQNRVSPQVVQTMQERPPVPGQPQPVVVQQAAPAVVVEGGYYRPWHPHPYYY